MKGGFPSLLHEPPPPTVCAVACQEGTESSMYPPARALALLAVGAKLQQGHMEVGLPALLRLHSALTPSRRTPITPSLTPQPHQQPQQ